MNIKRCGACPKWAGGWCSIFARRQPRAAYACEWGRKLIRNEYMRIYMREYNKKGARWKKES